nr:hypothetical protein [Halorubrum distributum]
MADLLNEQVNLRILSFIHILSSDALERGPLSNLVLDAHEQNTANDGEREDALALPEEVPRYSDGSGIEREKDTADDSHPYF